jgi:hypothetical protein
MKKKPTQAKSKPNQIEVVNNTLEVIQLDRGHKSLRAFYVALEDAQNVRSPDRTALLEVYKDLDTDGRLRGITEKRIRGCLKQEIQWLGLESKEHIENMRQPWFYKMIGQAMESIFKGYGLIELKLDHGLIYDTYNIPRQNILPHLRAIQLKEGDPDSDWLRYTEEPAKNYVLEVGDPSDLGLYAVAAQNVYPLRDALGDFALHNELFTMPLRVFYYDPSDPMSKPQVEAQAEAMTGASYLVLPKGKEYLEFVKSSSEGAAIAFETNIKIHLTELTTLVLGQASTTSNLGHGSGSSAKVHEYEERFVNLEDQRFITAFLNGPFKDAAIRHGYPLQNAKAKFATTQALTPTQRLYIWQIAYKWAVPISNEAWYREYDIPKPPKE